MTQITISEVAAKHLEKWAAALMNGSLELWELPPSVSEFYLLGYTEGRASQQPEIRRLEAETNRWYIYATKTDQQRKDAYNARLAQGLTEATEERWQQLEKDLHEMAGNTLTSGVPGIEVDDDSSNSRATGKAA